jgi:putative sporulation protein YtaF
VYVLSINLISTLEAILIVIALSSDALVASFAYGTNKIKIPFSSVLIINLICSLFLAISLYLGNILRPYIEVNLTKIICFFILFALGLTKLFDSTIKMLIRRYNSISKELKFSMFNFNFILNVYANPQEADTDFSRILSPIEASTLAIALSLDGIAVGFGSAIGNVNSLKLFAFSLISDIIAVMVGFYIGNKVANKIKLDLSWLSGVILIIVAIMKL